MIVYLVCGTVDYEGGTLYGIFSTSEKAQEQLDKLRDDHYEDNWCIREVVVDTTTEVEF